MVGGNLRSVFSLLSTQTQSVCWVPLYTEGHKLLLLSGAHSANVRDMQTEAKGRTSTARAHVLVGVCAHII